MRYRYQHGEREHEVEVSSRGGGAYRVSVDGIELELTLAERGDALELRTTQGTIKAWVGRSGALRFVSAPGVGDLVLERVESRRAGLGPDPGHGLAAPMPGRVVKLLVAPGDTVAKGQPLLVVEAMKTELTIVAPRDGRVKSIAARAGEMCEALKPLVELSD